MEAEVWTVIEVVVDGQVVDRRIVDRRSSSAAPPATSATAEPESSQPEKLRITDAPTPRDQATAPGMPPGPGRGSVDLVMIRQVEAFLEWDEPWSGYAGLGPEQIASDPKTRAEFLQLQAIGLAEPLDVVLKFGPLRVAEVRKWVSKIKKSQSVQNPAGLVLSTLKRGVPKGFKNKEKWG